MKKALFILLAIFLITGCKRGYVEEINVDQVTNMINNEKDFVLYVGSKDCPLCSSMEENLYNIVLENNIEVKMLDITEFMSDINAQIKLDNLLDDEVVPPKIYIYESGEKTETINTALTKGELEKKLSEG